MNHSRTWWIVSSTTRSQVDRHIIKSQQDEVQRLSNEQNKNRYEECEKSSWKIENKLYKSLNNSQMKI